MGIYYKKMEQFIVNKIYLTNNEDEYVFVNFFDNAEYNIKKFKVQ